MTESPLLARQRTLLRDLTHQAAERAQAEANLEQTSQTRREAIEREFVEALQAVNARFAAGRDNAERTAQEARVTIQKRFDFEQQAYRKEFATARQRLLDQYDIDKEATQTGFQEARWTIGAMLEGKRAEADTELREKTARVTASRNRLQELLQQARALLQGWKQPLAVLYPEEHLDPKTQPKLAACQALAEEHLEELQALSIPGFVGGKRFFGLILLLWLALIYPLGWLVTRYGGFSPTLAGIGIAGLAASFIVVLVIGVLVHAVLRSVARSQVVSFAQPLGEAVAAGEARCQMLVERYARHCKRRLVKSKKRHNRDLRSAQKKFGQQAKAIKKHRNETQPRLQARFESQCQASQERRDQELRQVEQRRDHEVTENQNRFDTDSRELHTRHDEGLAEVQAWNTQEWNRLAEAWRSALARARVAIAEINAEGSRYFPDWTDPTWQTWTPPPALPPVLRFGDYPVRKEQVPHAVPEDERLQDARLDDFTLPALCSFPQHYSLLFEAQDAGRAQAVDAVQAILFRLLTTIPPGKVRFTIVDPVGLGQNFASFMHLADHDELLVTSRIWTEAQHIEQRLMDLTAHMENVIQKYLRNRYETITDYNVEAGEVAEPFRVLVVANFPANFSDEAARRLISICQSGPRCGVSTLITVDTRLPLPRGFDLADLEQASVNLAWNDGRFLWKDPDFASFPLHLETPPPADLANRLLAQIGEQARHARRVEVPFEFIAPAVDRWWTHDSRRGLSIPLGRAGATKRQNLDLGQGTSQHVLVAGKTGSGKSTLLHALIVNLALHYSPDEVELYLIDFKKGVEFKTYAVHELPHARVVAIESEREFGLSVLQRLDAELRQRGERFRQAGAQDLKAFREASPNTPLPRILLIVDEFQEFFIEDDRLSQDAAQLLDRLVRQGRAFGLHVLLGSQTLGGAYSLARSTIDQMAIRIALQCSEADAQLILSGDNSAARLLSRPGEAIYNDANGLVEGNSPFQVVWLADTRREDYLEQLQVLSKQRQALPRPPVVFEGNAPADVAANQPLSALLHASTWPRASNGRGARQGCPAWLGEAMAIADQTAAIFRRQNGSNLLIVGQQDEAAQGMLATAIISLAAQTPPPDTLLTTSAIYYIVDGSQADPPETGLFAQMPDLMRHPLRLAGWRQLPEILTELSAEVERRQKTPIADAPAIYLVLYGLQRFRDLRRQDDDFSYMRRDEGPNPAQQFATLVREGAALGLHTLIWCDTMNNLQRAVDRQAMREFAMRVVFQMSVADSSNLIDNALASKLGRHRAFFSNEEEGRLEKFRPYGLPSDSWLAWVKRQLTSRTLPLAASSPTG
jgi:hypothetical protein